MSTPETNGRARADASDQDEAAPRDSAAIDLEDFDPDLEDDELEDDELGMSDRSLGIEVAFTPRQILGGFALLAALLLLLRRRRSSRSRD